MANQVLRVTWAPLDALVLMVQMEHKDRKVTSALLGYKENEENVDLQDNRVVLVQPAQKVHKVKMVIQVNLDPLDNLDLEVNLAMQGHKVPEETLDQLVQLLRTENVGNRETQDHKESKAQQVHWDLEEPVVKKELVVSLESLDLTENLVKLVHEAQLDRKVPLAHRDKGVKMAHKDLQENLDLLAQLEHLEKLVSIFMINVIYV